MNCNHHLSDKILVLFSFTLVGFFWLWALLFIITLSAFTRVTFPGNGLGEAALTLKMQLLMQPIQFEVTHENVLGDGTNKLIELFSPNLSWYFKCLAGFCSSSSLQFGMDLVFHSALQRSLKTWRINHYE